MKQLVTAAISDVERLVKLLVAARKSYYNDGDFYRADPTEFPKRIRPEKTVSITDKRYDALEDELRRLDPHNKLLRTVGVASRQKVKLPYYMGSLTKVRSASEISDWSSEYAGPYVVSDKIDGISILLVYKDGAVKLYTRGEATSGQDITHLATSLKLPSIKNGALRGELVMAKGKFSSKWSQAFKNPRNMAAGLANRKDVHDAVSDLTVMIYEVLAPRMKPSAALKWAKSKGFVTVAHKVVDKIPVSWLTDTFTRRRDKGHYEVDGLVIVQDQVHPLNKNPTPNWGRAFKSQLVEDAVDATVTSVEWNISRHGYLVPTIHVKPVDLRGVTIKKASGKNAAFIRDNKIGNGAVVRLRRAGDVIPDVRDGDVVRPSKADMPDKTYNWKWDATQTNIIVSDKQTKADPTVRVQVIEHFFKTLGVERIKAATLSLFVAEGYDSVLKILRMSRAEFTSIEGGTKTLAQVHDQLQDRLAQSELPTIMDASSVFGRSFGTRRCAMVVNALPNILQLADDRNLVQRIDDIPGFDTKTATMFAERLPHFVKWLRQSKIKPVVKKVRKTGNKLSGQVVLFTGFRDPGLEELIKQQGGTIASGISKATVLLAKDPGGSSSKLNKARQLGVKIMDAITFRRKFGL